VQERGPDIGLNKIKIAQHGEMRRLLSSFFDGGLIKIKGRLGERFLY